MNKAIGLALLAVGIAQTLLAEPPPLPKASAGHAAASMPLDKIGAVVAKQHSGDGLAAVTSSPDGAMLRCALQKLNGRVTTEGLWLISTADGAHGKGFQVIARALGRREDAAALGYYVADAHDPLNTTENYDGQLTGQTGLAARFGVKLVGRYKNFILFRSVPAAKIDDPTEYAFQIILEANTWVDRVLYADRNALDDLPDYNEDYYDRFYTAVSSIVIDELGRAAHDIGSYWYTAWLNAGQPSVPNR